MNTEMRELTNQELDMVSGSGAKTQTTPSGTFLVTIDSPQGTLQVWTGKNGYSSAQWDPK
jgi:hypothetical protein